MAINFGIESFLLDDDDDDAPTLLSNFEQLSFPQELRNQDVFGIELEVN